MILVFRYPEIPGFSEICLALMRNLRKYYALLEECTAVGGWLFTACTKYELHGQLPPSTQN
jgi:hypothetical protein